LCIAYYAKDCTVYDHKSCDAVKSNFLGLTGLDRMPGESEAPSSSPSESVAVCPCWDADDLLRFNRDASLGAAYVSVRRVGSSLDLRDVVDFGAFDGFCSVGDGFCYEGGYLYTETTPDESAACNRLILERVMALGLVNNDPTPTSPCPCFDEAGLASGGSCELSTTKNIVFAAGTQEKLAEVQSPPPFPPLCRSYGAYCGWAQVSVQYDDQVDILPNYSGNFIEACSQVAEDYCNSI